MDQDLTIVGDLRGNRVIAQSVQVAGSPSTSVQTVSGVNRRQREERKP